MFQELCTIFNMAPHIQYQCGLHGEPGHNSYNMTLQCVYSRESDQNGHFNHFSRYFTIKAPARRLSMLRELCTTFNMAPHNSYKVGLHGYLGQNAYNMMQQCVLFTVKVGEN